MFWFSACLGDLRVVYVDRDVSMLSGAFFFVLFDKFVLLICAVRSSFVFRCLVCDVVACCVFV